MSLLNVHLRLLDATVEFVGWLQPLFVWPELIFNKNFFSILYWETQIKRDTIYCNLCLIIVKLSFQGFWVAPIPNHPLITSIQTPNADHQSRTAESWDFKTIFWKSRAELGTGSPVLLPLLHGPAPLLLSWVDDPHLFDKGRLGITSFTARLPTKLFYYLSGQANTNIKTWAKFEYILLPFFRFDQIRILQFTSRHLLNMKGVPKKTVIAVWG